MTSGRIQRWRLFLSGYQYTLRHRSGSSNGNADALSRLPLDAVGEEEAVPEAAGADSEGGPKGPVTPLTAVACSRQLTAVYGDSSVQSNTGLQ